MQTLYPLRTKHRFIEVKRHRESISIQIEDIESWHEKILQAGRNLWLWLRSDHKFQSSRTSSIGHEKLVTLAKTTT